MTGMKEGAGEDPFAEDTNSGSVEENESSNIETDVTQTSSKKEDERDTGRQTRQQQSMQIPYKFRRDGVQDGRDRVPLFLHEETKTDERDALRELEERFDDSVSLTDLREAVVKVGLEHLDEVELELEEWGYGLTFDE